MATKLQDFAFMPKVKIAKNTAKASPDTQPSNSQTETETMADLKAEILSSVKADISALLRTELTEILASKFEELKNEIQAVKSEVVGNIAVFRADLDSVTGKVTDMEHSLTTCSNDVTELQSVVTTLKAEVKGLQDKCVDLEGRMRRSNLRILNVPEEHDSSPSAVTKMLKEIFNVDRNILIDRSHRTPQLQRGGKPRPIIAKVHYYQDCVEILRRARQAGGDLKYRHTPISIFQDYPPSIARARSAYNEVKQLLRGRVGFRYGVVHPAKFRISHDGIEKTFSDPESALTYAKKNISAANSSSED